MSKRIKITIAATIALLVVTLSSVVLYAAIKPVRATSEQASTGGQVAVMPIKPVQLNALAIEALVNVERANLGLPAFVHNDQLTTSACAKLDYMVAHNYWSHDAPDGTTAWSFILATGYDYRKASENQAYGQASDESVVSGWMSSPAHRANIVGPSVEQGVCTKTVAFQGATNTVTVQHLGIPR